jgi:ribosomal protein S12 methylthiotransferase accessory factor
MAEPATAGTDRVEVAPIHYRGTPFRTPKTFTHGTHRCVPPQETFELVRPFLRQAGVTRVADITGLDNVGVPVTLALRPNATTIACSSGKGLTLAAALASGAMEAIEIHAAETVVLPSVRATYAELASDGVVPGIDDLPLSRASVFHVDWPLDWHFGWDLMSGRELAVPLVMVRLARDRSSLGAFVPSSNGLGAGNSFLEAVAAALYEVIERDAVACHQTASLAGGLVPLYPDSMLQSFPLVADLVGRCDAAGVHLLISDCTADTAVPTCMVYAYDADGPSTGTFKGFGAHLDPEIALLRGVTEALQSRLNFIAGARDDLFRSAFWRVQGRNPHRYVTAIESRRDQHPIAAPTDSRSTSSIEGDIHELLTRLRAVGQRSVIVVDITPPGFPVHVVRVVAPGLEGYMHHGYTPGRRARAWVRRLRG